MGAGRFGAEPVNLPLHVARALRPKRQRHIGSARILRHVERRSTARVRDVRIGAVHQEKIDDVAVSSSNRVMERRFAAVVDGIDVCLAREKPHGEPREAADRGVMEERPPALILRIERCALCEERIDDPLAARGGRAIDVDRERVGIPLDCAAGVEKQPGRLDISFAQRAHEGRLPVVIPRIQLRAARGEQLHDLRVPVRGREMERRLPLRAPLVEGCPFRDEKLHDGPLTLPRREMNRRVSPRIPVFERRPMGDEGIDDRGVPVVRRVEKRRLIEGVPGIGLGAPREEHENGVHRAHHRGYVKGRVLPFVPGVHELRRSIDELSEPRAIAVPGRLMNIGSLRRAGNRHGKPAHDQKKSQRIHAASNSFRNDIDRLYCIIPRCIRKNPRGTAALRRSRIFFDIHVNDLLPWNISG